MARKKKTVNPPLDTRKVIIGYIEDASSECPACGHPDLIASFEDSAVVDGFCVECNTPRVHIKRPGDAAIMFPLVEPCP
jgi:Zn ribbon nucleic-acid-binding protein